MHATTLSFANFHNHGELFSNILRARRDSFIRRRAWNLPEAMGMEFDQYDTPQARWLAVHDEGGRVLAGCRLMPTTARCGVYSYMIRDAQDGMFETIPSDLLFDRAPVDPGIWEVTRGFVADDLAGARRSAVRLRLVLEMHRACQQEGIRRMLALLPVGWHRWAARCKLVMEPAGREMDMGGVIYQAVWIDFALRRH